MIDRQQHARGHELSPRSIPLGQFWSSLTSEIGGLFTQGTASSTVVASPETTTIEMVTTKSNGGPALTTTVKTTLVRTSFVTVHITGGSKPQPASSSSSDLLPPIATNNHHTSLPHVITGHSTKTTTSPRHTLETNQPAKSPSSTASPVVSASSDGQRQAIIGGLAGAIAGLVIIGVLICFFLRRRKLRDEESESHQSLSEKGIRPVLARKWTALTAKTQTTRQASIVSRGSTPDFDGGLIRMSLEHWPRPFAYGEGFRESMGPGQLRVMNPDPSRPVTPLPKGSSESQGGFLRHQKSALAAVLLATRSRGNSSVGSPDRGVPMPAIAIDPGSTESVAAKAPTPSFRSYPSVSTLPVVEQRPPEDPFLTPPDERDELSTPSTPRPRRPSIAPLQNAAGSAGRTLSHIGSALNPFRSRSNVAESLRSYSRHSNSTFSSAGDPFKLDRPSIHEQNARMGSELERNPMPKWNVYEGT